MGVGNAVISREPPRGEAFDSVPSAIDITDAYAPHTHTRLIVCAEDRPEQTPQKGEGDSRCAEEPVPAAAPSTRGERTMVSDMLGVVDVREVWFRQPQTRAPISMVHLG